jgi:hypothetical protein
MSLFWQKTVGWSLIFVSFINFVVFTYIDERRSVLSHYFPIDPFFFSELKDIAQTVTSIGTLVLGIITVKLAIKKDKRQNSKDEE